MDDQLSLKIKTSKFSLRQLLLKDLVPQKFAQLQKAGKR